MMDKLREILKNKKIYTTSDNFVIIRKVISVDNIKCNYVIKKYKDNFDYNLLTTSLTGLSEIIKGNNLNKELFNTLIKIYPEYLI